MKFDAYRPMDYDQDGNLLNTPVAFPMNLMQRYDALYSWFHETTSVKQFNILAADGAVLEVDDLEGEASDRLYPDTEMFMQYLKRREDRYYIRNANGENKPPSMTNMIQRIFRMGGDLIENSRVLEERLRALPNTLLLSGYNIGEKDPTHSPIDAFIRLSREMDTTIDEFIIANLNTRDALEFIKKQSEDAVTMTLDGEEITAPKWWFEGYALNKEFVKVPFFRKNIERIVFTYIDKEIDQGNFDLKRSLKYISRLGRFNTKIYLVC